jgi:SRSO17 transposase
LRKKFVALRAWRLTAQGEAHIGWLLGERATQGQAEERKFYWSNLPASATLEELVDYAHRRHAIEQLHEEAKGELGWDHYQGRLWRGFHRHAVTVMLALSFLIWQELRERENHPKRGRPRDPFSPYSQNIGNALFFSTLRLRHTDSDIVFARGRIGEYRVSRWWMIPI